MRYKKLDEGYCQGCMAFPEKGIVGVEYAPGTPERYDGISEYECCDCGRREGRWSGKVLAAGELEPRYGGRP